MKSKKLLLPILGVALSLATGSIAKAQAPDDGGPRPHRHGPPDMLEMLNHTLQLTDAQKTQVKPLVDEALPQLKEIHEQARAAAEAVIKKLDAQVRPLLTPEQQTKLDAMEAMHESGPHGPPPE